MSRTSSATLLVVALLGTAAGVCVGVVGRPSTGARVGIGGRLAARSALRMSSPAQAVRNQLGDTARATLDGAQAMVREAQAALDTPSKHGGSTVRWLLMRRTALARVLAFDQQAYLTAVAELGPRLPRAELPNRQGVPALTASAAATILPDGTIQDCLLSNVTYAESPLDVLLLSVFRKFVQDETGFKSDKPTMAGLAEEGRTYMLRASEEEQQMMVRNVLRRLFTPAGPPFYKIFMSGVFGERKLGPWFWAPALTSWVTPLFFKFLVGPSTPNYRADGQLGGLVVEKCRFLQESGCKGLCVHQCKLPAQQFFAEDLGLALTVQPNFETQECQWSFGEVPLPVEVDPSLPAGCLTGCPSRKALGEAKAYNKCS